jgi:hypothetical protein
MWYVLFPALPRVINKGMMLHLAVSKRIPAPMAEVNVPHISQASARWSSVPQPKQHTVVHSLANCVKGGDFAGS